MGLQRRRQVRVVSRRGELTGVALVTAAMRKGEIFVPFVSLQDSAANFLTNNAYDPNEDAGVQGVRGAGGEGAGGGRGGVSFGCACVSSAPHPFNRTSARRLMRGTRARFAGVGDPFVSHPRRRDVRKRIIGHMTASPSDALDRARSLRSELEELTQRLDSLLNAVAELAGKVSRPTLARNEWSSNVASPTCSAWDTVPAELSALAKEFRTSQVCAVEAGETLFKARSSLTDLLAVANAALARTQPGGRARSRAGDDTGSELRPRAPASVPRGFVLDGTHYAASRWTDLVRQLVHELVARHAGAGERLLGVTQGRSRPIFSRRREDLVRPEDVPGTEIYMDIYQRSPRDLTAIALQVARTFGYSEDRFAVLEPD